MFDPMQHLDPRLRWGFVRTGIRRLCVRLITNTQPNEMPAKAGITTYSPNHLGLSTNTQPIEMPAKAGIQAKNPGLIPASGRRIQYAD